MQVRLLGPVDVALDGAPRPVNGLRRKAVLAALALHDGEVVSTDWLVDVVWGESAPPTVVNSLQTHISYLRGVLGGKEAILARPPGYLLNLGGDGTDARAAERLLRQGYTDSLRHVQHAHDHYQAAGQRVGQARVLNGIGWLHAKLGDYRRALSQCQQALAMLQELDDTVGAAYAMDSVAYIHRHLGDRHQAVACYQQAHDLYREVGESEGEAEALTQLGDIHHENGDVDAARDAWRQALDILSQLGHPDAEQVRAKLTALGQAGDQGSADLAFTQA